MMTFWILGAAGLISLAVVVAQVAQYRHERTLKKWDSLLSPGSRFAIKSLEGEVQTDAAMVDDGLHGAKQAREKQNLAEAVQLLELSSEAVARATPSRLRRLKAMAVLIRMASALAPVRPLRVRDYRLRELIAVVGVAAALHQVVISALERFLLRLYVLGVGFRLTWRVMTRAHNRIVDAPAVSRSWHDYERAIEDWKTLDREHLETFKALTRSLEAEPRE